jgi:hypothetical protein
MTFGHTQNACERPKSCEMAVNHSPAEIAAESQQTVSRAAVQETMKR